MPRSPQFTSSRNGDSQSSPLRHMSPIAHFVAHLGFTGDQIGNNEIVILLAAVDFDFADFHAFMIQKKALVRFGHLADGKTSTTKRPAAL